MKSKPLLMQPDMVRATLREIREPDTGKRQTRRIEDGRGHAIIEKATPEEWNAGRAHPNMRRYEEWGPRDACQLFRISTGSVVAYPCPYGRVGDVLWLRESWRTETDYYNDLPPSELSGEETILYEADANWSDNKTVGRLRPSIHMPRWASRLTLELTDVRVERVQDISEADAVAEGIRRTESLGGCANYWYSPTSKKFPSAREAFRELWGSINESRGYGWDTNPWVWVLSYKPHLINVDEFIERG